MYVDRTLQFLCFDWFYFDRNCLKSTLVLSSVFDGRFLIGTFQLNYDCDFEFNRQYSRDTFQSKCPESHESYLIIILLFFFSLVSFSLCCCPCLPLSLQLRIQLPWIPFSWLLGTFIRSSSSTSLLCPSPKLCCPSNVRIACPFSCKF